MKLLFVPVLLMSALVIADSKPEDLQAAVKPTPTQWTTQWPTQWTTEDPGLNLNGKMFTLARYSSKLTLYHPYFPISSWSLTPKTEEIEKKQSETQSYPTPSYPPWTKAPPTRGVSVCLRYMFDYLDDETPTIFTLSPSNRFLSLEDNYPNIYRVTFRGQSFVKLYPSIKLWSNILPSAWTSVCLTIDSKRNVIQLFKGAFMSIRKVLSTESDWTSEPVMEFSRYSGQVKDVQVWNYPLRYKDVYYYMTEDSYWSPQGNALSWSHISYSLQGDSFLEDSYESQARQSIRRGRRLNGVERSRKGFINGESEGTRKEMV